MGTENAYGGMLAEIAQAIEATKPPVEMTTRVVAIDGLGGAGKSTLAARLAQELGGAQIVHTDDFASWENPIDWWPRLIQEVLEPLSRNQSGHFLRTDWSQSGREEWGTVTPANVVILEGVSASRAAFRPFLSYAIWVHAPRDVRLRRGLGRDGEEALAQWEAWMQAEDEYVEWEMPEKNADCVVSGEDSA